MTCGGDSGSPLVTFDSITGQYTQVGIVSGGSCASYTNPGIFARLEHQTILKFIQDNAWDNMPISSTKIIEKLLEQNEVLTRQVEELKKSNTQLKKSNEQLESKIEDIAQNVREGLPIILQNLNLIIFAFRSRPQ